MALYVQVPRRELFPQLFVTPTAAHSSVMHGSSSSNQHLHLILNFSCAQSPTGSCTPNLILQAQSVQHCKVLAYSPAPCQDVSPVQ